MKTNYHEFGKHLGVKNFFILKDLISAHLITNIWKKHSKWKKGDYYGMKWKQKFFFQITFNTSSFSWIFIDALFGQPLCMSCSKKSYLAANEFKKDDVRVCLCKIWSYTFKKTSSVANCSNLTKFVCTSENDKNAWGCTELKIYC